MTENQVILIGWKSIRKALGGVSEDTAKKIIRKHKIPMARINDRPAILIKDLLLWSENLKTHLL